MVPFYGLLLAVSWRLDFNDPIRLTFNSMLAHMLRGQFDVDPNIVQVEGFLRNGRVYSYFGIWGALLRLPLWPLHRMNLDVTFPSCLAAICLAGLAKIRMVLLVGRHGLRSASANYAIGLMLAYVVFAGSATTYLETSIYLEALLWGYAFAAMFVYCAISGILNSSFPLTRLSCMATCAGFALLARVTAGVALYLALFLLLVALASPPDVNLFRHPLSVARQLGRNFVRAPTIVPLAILALFMAATGAVNYFRWGNPMMFANYDLYAQAHSYPNFLPSLHTYGAFNVRRIPFGLVYYFFPIWVLHGPGGRLLFERMLTSLIGVIGLPPCTFLLTDLLPLAFIASLAIAVWRKSRSGLAVPGRWAAAISLGLLAPCVLMLGFTWVLFRYRLEFYPELEFLAFLGLFLTVTDPAMLLKFTRCRRWLAAALLVSVFASMTAFVLSNLSGDEAPQLLLQHGVVNYYKDQAAFHLHRTILRDFSPHR